MYERILEMAKLLTENLFEERGLYSDIRIVERRRGYRDPLDGVYIVFGCTDYMVTNITFDPYYLREEYNEREMEEYAYYPEAEIFKLESDSAVDVSKFCDRLNEIHLLKELFERYQLPVPEKLSEQAYIRIANKHYDSIDATHTVQQREQAKEELKQLLIEQTNRKEEKPEETEREEEREQSGFLERLGFRRKRVQEDNGEERVIYKPTIPQALSAADLKQHGNVYLSVDVKHDILLDFEKEVAEYKNVRLRFHVEEQAKQVYGEEGIEYRHVLTFHEAAEKIFMGIVHKYQHQLQDRAKKYTPGRKDVRGIEVLESDFDIFRKCAENWGVDFFYDEHSVYARNAVDRIAIAAEGLDGIAMLMAAVHEFVKVKRGYSYLSHDPEYTKNT